MFRKIALCAVAIIGLVSMGAVTAQAGDFSIRLGKGFSISFGDRDYYHSRYRGRYDDYRYPVRRYPGHRPNIYRPVGHRPVIVQPVVAHYRVLYRECEHDPWAEYGCYDCRSLAQRIADRLCHHGYEARVICD